MTGSADQCVKIWDVNAGKVTQTLNGHLGPISTVAIDHRDEFVVSATGRTFPLLYQLSDVPSDARELRVWRIADGSLMKTLPMNASVADLAFSNDGKLLAVALLDHYEDLKGGPNPETVVSHSGEIQIREWPSLDLVHTLHGRAQVPMRENVPTSLAFSHQGRTLAVGYHPFTDIVVWDLSQTPQRLCTLAGHKDTVSGLAFSHDDSLIVSSSNDQTVRLWSWKNRVELTQFKLPMDKVSDLAISADQTINVSGTRRSQGLLATFSLGSSLAIQTWHDLANSGRHREDAILDNVGKIVERHSFDASGKQVYPSKIIFDYVRPGSLAEELGIREGDELALYNDQPMPRTRVSKIA